MKEGGLAVPDLKLYYEAVVIKTIWYYWLRDIREDQWNRLGVSDISKTVYDNPKSPASGTKTHSLTKTSEEIGKQYRRDWV